MRVTVGSSSGPSWDFRPHMRAHVKAQCHYGSFGTVPNPLCTGGVWAPDPDSLAGVHPPAADLVWSCSWGSPSASLPPTWAGRKQRLRVASPRLSWGHKQVRVEWRRGI